MNNLFCNGYPYTDFHELNLSWVVKKIVELNTRLTEFVSLNTIKYADPIQWNITSQYGTNTVVIDPVSGVAYLSTKPVPMGVSLSDTDYWTEIFDLGQIIGNINKNLTVHNDGYSTTSTYDLEKGDWVLWNGVLYEAMHDIDIGDAYVPDANIKAKSVEELIVSYVDGLKIMIDHVEDLVASEVTARADADDVLRALIEAEADAREDADDVLRVELSDLISSKVDIEAHTRADEDARIDLELRDVITSKVGIEASARIAGDNALNARINQITAGEYKNTFVNVKALGAIGDNTLHPLSEYYDSLADARVDYPFVNSLNVSIDYAAIQKAVNNNRMVYIPSGNYIVNYPIIFTRGTYRIVGDAKDTTWIKAAINTLEIFTFTRTNASCSLNIEQLTFSVTSTSFTQVKAIYFHGLIDGATRYEDNWLTVNDCEFYDLWRCFDLYACSNVYVNRCRSSRCQIFAYLTRAASFVHFSKCLALVGQYMFYCDDANADGVSNGLYLDECIGVFQTGVAFRILGWQLVELYKCSGDLNSSTDGAAYLRDCQDVMINGCWFACTGFDSYAAIRLWDCYRTHVQNCTISNANTGLYITAPNASATTVMNNSFLANNWDIGINGGTGISIIGNTCQSTAHNNISGTGTDKNVCIGNLFVANTWSIQTSLGANSVIANNLFNWT